MLRKYPLHFIARSNCTPVWKQQPHKGLPALSPKHRRSVKIGQLSLRSGCLQGLLEACARLRAKCGQIWRSLANLNKTFTRTTSRVLARSPTFTRVPVKVPSMCGWLWNVPQSGAIRNSQESVKAHFAWLPLRWCDIFRILETSSRGSFYQSSSCWQIVFGGNCGTFGNAAAQPLATNNAATLNEQDALTEMATTNEQGKSRSAPLVWNARNETHACNKIKTTTISSNSLSSSLQFPWNWASCVPKTSNEWSASTTRSERDTIWCHEGIRQGSIPIYTRISSLEWQMSLPKAWKATLGLKE